MDDNSEESRINSGKTGIVVFKPKKGIFQRAYTKAAIEINGEKYEAAFDSILEIELPPKRYEFFCYGICPGEICKEGGTFILNEDEAMIILFKPSGFKFLK